MNAGEGTFVSIRGVEPNLNNVTFNGTTVAPPGVDGRTGRATELEAQIPFSAFLGKGVLAGFSVNANATFIKSKVTVPGRESEDLPFFQQPDRIFNLALSYQKDRITARIAYNYQTESLTLLGGESSETGSEDEYQADRYFIDLQASVKLSERFSIFANWKNVTNEYDDTYIGERYRLRQSHDFGSDFRAACGIPSSVPVQ